MDRKIAILGCGNLGQSIVKGLLYSGKFPPGNISATKRHLASIKYLKEQGVIISSNNKHVVADSEIIVIAVKPYNVQEIIEEISGVLQSGKHTIVSVATATSIGSIKKKINKEIDVIRAMPNTATDICQSVTTLAYEDDIEERSLQSVKEFFNHIGITIRIDEELMEAATIMGACGIAYVMRFIRAMTQGGIEIGFDAKTASDIVNQTVRGASSLLIERKEHPEFEIDKVTTPRGCTIVGLNEMEHYGFSSSLIRGIVASYRKIEK